MTFSGQKNPKSPRSPRTAAENAEDFGHCYTEQEAISFAKILMPAKRIPLEICLDSVESAVASAQGGADRVELCADLLEGGITPSAGLIAAVRQKISIGLQVMIRPRGGDFCYTEAEFEIMRKDIRMARQLGANGVVFGILDPDGHIDTKRTRELVELSRPLNVTHHRAFDMALDLYRALEDVISTGADRILTSGGEATVSQGLDTISRLVRAAGDRIIIMPGGGITQDDIRRVAEQSGAREIHVGLGTEIPSPMLFRNQKIAMGSIEGYEYKRMVVQQGDVASLVESLKEVSAPV